MTGRAAAVALVGVLALSSCVLPRNVERSGRPLRLDRSAPGRTRLSGLLLALGPPDAVAAPGQDGRAAAGGPGRPGDGDLGLDLVPAEKAETWFALFLVHEPFAASHRVYHWTSSSSDGFSVVLPFFLIQRRYVTTEEVWALVDQATGQVVEVVERSTG